jgi:putative membrane protein
MKDYGFNMPITKRPFMKNRNLIAAVMLSGLALQACQSSDQEKVPGTATTLSADSALDTVGAAATKKESKLTPEETEFVNKAGIGGMMEVEAGNLALQKSKSPIIKEFATMMVKDHTAANTQLEAIAKNVGLQLANTFPKTEQAHMDAMTGLQGDGFDRHYMQMMVTDHVKDLELFRTATRAEDPAVRTFATKTLPILEGHYKKAKEISDRLEKQKMNNGDDILGISPTKEENMKPVKK